jgi:hypothetical protein
MEPGRDDREEVRRIVAARIVQLAAMEPGRDDREEPTHQSPRPGPHHVPLWSPAVMTGKSWTDLAPRQEYTAPLWSPAVMTGKSRRGSP